MQQQRECEAKLEACNKELEACKKELEACKKAQMERQRECEAKLEACKEVNEGELQVMSQENHELREILQA
jgi:hypothetical protein